MNKKWITLLFSFSLCFCMSCSDSESDKKEEGKVEEEKPVTVLSKTVPLADPYILVHDSLYYIYGTNVGTGFDVYYSKDLEYWERASALSLSHANSYGESMFWAPEVYYVEKDKKFYMFYSTEEHICVATADSPLGPFKQDEHKPIREEKSFGSCAGSCTHVWNYEVATPFLFGELAKTMRDVEFNYATKENGLMNFRASLPLSEAAKGNSAAADGQMGCVMKIYRDWQLSGDDEFLQKNWGQVKKVLAYAWTDKGWDGNQDGIMEGSQHNTMDVNYFGPNPQMGFWYMGALKAAEKMALAMKDKTFAKKCNTLFRQGSIWMDANLFNGEYYEHKITDPETFEYLDMRNPDVKVPPFQLGKGCLVDQLVGQYMAHICGLGYLGDKEHIRTTLGSIMKYNYVKDFSRYFNNMRSYVMGDESGLLMASWPKGRLEVPFPYFAEVMTGFEYCAAVGMIYEGMEKEALTCIRAIRDRHDGAKRNPFSEAECGHHYARSMASWAAVIALSDFQYSGVDRRMHFTDRPGCYFWSNGYAWGTCTVTDDTATIEVLKGSLQLDKLVIGDKEKRLKNFRLASGENRIIKLS